MKKLFTAVSLFAVMIFASIHTVAYAKPCESIKSAPAESMDFSSTDIDEDEDTGDYEKFVLTFDDGTTQTIILPKNSSQDNELDKEEFEEKFHKAIMFVELYEEKSACCLWNNEGQGDFYIKKYILEEVVSLLRYIEDNEEAATSYRSWDIRILPYLRALPYYEDELKTVNEILKDNERVNRILLKH